MIEQGAVGEDKERGETALQRVDRNWLEILQELRVLQTGIQILTGFLLTLPFQSRFTELDSFQIAVYLVLVVLSALITALLLGTVIMHRTFFRLRIKEALVRHAHRILRATMMLVAVVLIGTTGLIFDIVLNRTAGSITAISLAVLIFALWVAVPQLLKRRSIKAASPGEDPGTR
ncbi:DUF6328 family protein [uncultured Arthrobacter sp.]|uniref:DUF6328 family protein n=1 Tax=uncultured Arthrobacter sp. TaxID=114050 RepID=UPI002625FDF7|nr:DUF6328 family protein [uncultured Arthrobacter sp.]